MVGSGRPERAFQADYISARLSQGASDAFGEFWFGWGPCHCLSGSSGSTQGLETGDLYLVFVFYILIFIKEVLLHH